MTRPPEESPATEAPRTPTFREASRFWIWLGFVNFGGPAGQIALMHQELVERRRWIDEGRFLHALSFCMLLPGPEATQLATYVGWLLHRVRGGLVAGIAFVLPSFFLLLGLSWLFVTHGDLGWVAGAFAGLAAAVVAIVANAMVRLGRTTLANGLMIAVAMSSFVAIFVIDVPFPVVVAAAVVVGLIGGRIRPSLFEVGAGKELEERAAASVVGRLDTPRPRGAAASSCSSSGWRHGGSRSRRSRCGDGTRARWPTWGCSSRRPRSSRSAARTPCSRTWTRPP